MKDNQLVRYSRQIALLEIDIQGQKKINLAKVLVIGIGALGTVASNYLCRSGIGKLGIYDFDQIDVSNLHGQVLYKTSDIGKSKVKQALKEFNFLTGETKRIKVLQDAECRICGHG